MRDLAQAEPTVQAARAAVKDIKKQHLNEVRNLVNPPEMVKKAMESVCTILGNKTDGWKSVQVKRTTLIFTFLNNSKTIGQLLCASNYSVGAH